MARGEKVCDSQTRSHCFCGGEAKVDTTVYVDALTGQTIVKE